MPRFALRTLAAALCCISLNALADVKIGVIASSTGVTAVVGIPQKNTAALLPAEIGGQKVEYIVLDDASDPTNAVTNVKKLLTEHKVDALIGPTTTPAALAMLDFVAEAKVPLVTTVGSSAIVLPMDDKKKWVFKTTQNDDLIAKPSSSTWLPAASRHSASSASTIPMARTGTRSSHRWPRRPA
jgi:branched-chain amino acid transport system substrate-binding protein